MNGYTPSQALDLTAYAGHALAVLGLGVSGLSAARALDAAGADVRAWDDGPERRDAAAQLGLDVRELDETDLDRREALVLSPGIPHGHPTCHPAVARARAAGCEILCDLELLTRVETEARFVGITGTNGKSTTTALTGHILSELGIASASGGNIGAPGLDLPALGPAGIYVLEVSSYQLELLPSAVFDVAVLLNITPDHLDRHGGMDGYIAAKRRVFAGQGAGHTAIVGIDNEPTQAIFEGLQGSSAATIVPISTRTACTGGIYIQNGWLIDDRNGTAEPIVEVARFEALPGSHNAQNIAAAYAVSTAIAGDVPGDAIIAAIASFPGLAHRQELVGFRDAIRYVNDSKATNAEAAEHALAAYDEIYWIVGGIAKEGGIEALADLFGRVRHAFLIGEAADEFADTLEGRIPFTVSGDLKTALHDATAKAEAAGGPATVLLSPACASFDQFASFEARGDAFRAAVHALEGYAPTRPGGAA